MKAEEKALELKQKFGMATFGSLATNGMTLPEDLATKMAIICVEEIIQASPHDYWNEVLLNHAKLNGWKK